MTRIPIALVALALVAAGCSSDSGTEVASLVDEQRTTPSLADPSDEVEVDGDDAVLAFAACMRDAGLEDFEDPEIDGDGRIRFGFRELAEAGEIDRETIRTAMEACRSHLDGLSFGREQLDRSEIEDQLYEFAACMRDNGYDMPDPDFDIEPGTGQGQGGGLFGDLDRDDPAFQSALEACQEAFGGQIRLGGPGGGGGQP